jgi:hypothetical protein
MRAIFDVRVSLVEVGMESAVDTWVEVSWMEDKVRFLPSYLKLEVADHFVHELTLRSFGSRQDVYIFIAA